VVTERGVPSDWGRLYGLQAPPTPAARAWRANNTIATLALDGTGTLRLQAFVGGNGTVHVILDVVGYFE
jgi:hypothetical protein